MPYKKRLTGQVQRARRDGAAQQQPWQPADWLGSEGGEGKRSKGHDSGRW